MNLSEIAEKASLEKVFWNNDCEILHAYTGDLLSLVMKNAKPDSIWITVQSHVNIVAVASMVGIRAIILCEGVNLPEDTLEKARIEGINILRSQEDAFRVSGRLYDLGLR
ncbi:MAG: iron-sulfur binding hydrogenase [Thermosipho sp. (in: Bacteria)]|nr:iron-sulfur binding hydrogenase [Thermosipho sp. (in: thermotogales)]